MSSVFSEDRWHLHPFAVMIIAADRTGNCHDLCARRGSPSQCPCHQQHQFSSFASVWLAQDQHRHNTTCTPTQCHKPKQKVQSATPDVVKRDNIGICTRSTHRPPITVEIGVDLKPVLPVCLASKTHWQDRFQVYTKERIVLLGPLSSASDLSSSSQPSSARDSLSAFCRFAGLVEVKGVVGGKRPFSRADWFMQGAVAGCIKCVYIGISSPMWQAVGGCIPTCTAGL